MTLAEIFAALDARQPVPAALSAGAHPIAIRSALALLAPIIGLQLAAIDLPPPSFSVRFPKDAVPDEAAGVFGRELSRYRAWRRVILDAQLLATRRVVDHDPWDALRRVTRLVTGASEVAALYALGSRMPGLAPRDLSFARAVATQERLSGTERATFRRAYVIIGQLHDHELATGLGILPPRLGPLPRRERLPEHPPVPPKLAEFAVESGVEVPAVHCWTIAVRAGLVPADSDPDPASAFPPEIWARLAAADPRVHGMELLPGTMAGYRQRLAHALTQAGAPDPRVCPIPGAWRALKSAIRRRGRRADGLSAVSLPATQDGLRPSDITPQWISALLARETDRLRRNAIRSAAMLLDTLGEDASIPAELLARQPTGIVHLGARESRRAPRPTVNPVKQAWAEFLSDACAEGIPKGQLAPVIRLGRRAERRRLRPADLNAPAVEDLCRRSTRAERAAVADALEAFRLHPALCRHLPPEPIGPSSAHKPGRGLAAVDPGIAAEADALLAEQGAAPSTRRAAKAAGAALSRAALATNLPLGSLDDLLRLDASALDWSSDAQWAPAHQKAIGLLRSFRFLPWTPAWRALQRAAVAAGVGMVENPVASLLVVAGGREPAELDGAWARAIDRRHRTAGRADLARTFEANVARLDRLHTIPAIAAAGLPRIARPPRRSGRSPSRPASSRRPTILARQLSPIRRSGTGCG